MFFSKNEVIELEDNKNYLILDTTMLDNEVFYQIQEVKNNNVTGKKQIIKAVNDEGSLYIEDIITEEALIKLEEIFAG